MESAENLFNRLLSGGVERIYALVDEAEEESEILEFKTKTQRSGNLADTDKQNLAKSISAFANGDGGVLVWGIDCRSIKESADVAKEAIPVTNLCKFISDLKDCVPQIAAPPVQGIEFAKVETSEETNEGFVIMYVPRGDGEPVMATATKQYRYYVRAGRSTVIMTHSMVADRFGRRPQPKLELFWRAEYSRTGGKQEALIFFGLRNSGKSLAKFPAVRFHSTESFSGASIRPYPQTYGTSMNWFKIVQPDRLDNTSLMCIGDDSQFIHLGIATEVCTSWLGDISKLRSLKVEYELFCDGFYERTSLFVDREEVWRQLGCPPEQVNQWKQSTPAISA